MNSWGQRGVRGSGPKRRRQPDACGGFSLVELLVTVMIIGLLAAISIPVFLSQRDRAYESAVQADLRNAGTLQVSQLQAGQGPARNLDELVDLGFRPSRGVVIVDADFLSGGNEFCIEARAEHGSGRLWSVSSDRGIGVVEDDPC